MAKSLVKNSFFNILYRLTNVLFPLITISYVSRILSANGMGKIAYAQNIVSYFLLAASLGIPSYGIRQLARVKEDLYERSKLFSELFWINFFSTLIFAVGYYIVISIIPLFRERYIYHLIYSSLLIFNILNVDWLFQGMEEFGYIATRNIFVKTLSIIALFCFIRTEQDCILYAIISCLTTIGVYILNLFNLKKLVKIKARELQYKQHFNSIIYLFATTIALEFYSKIDITMIGAFWGDKEVGYYSNAFNLTNTIISVLIAITAVFLPRLSQYYLEDKQAFTQLVNLGMKILLLLGLPMFIGVNMLADSLVLTLFGNGFTPAIHTVRILSLLILIKGIGDLLCYQVLLSANKEKMFLISAVIAAVVNIILNSQLIPLFKYDGAAFASVVSELMYNGILLCFALKEVRIKIAKKYLFSLIISLTVMSGIVLVFKFLPIPHYFKLILGGGAGAATYSCILLFTKNEIIVSGWNMLKNKRRYKLRR